jgi:nicotinate-nucleotide adenylyltransferase
LLKIGLLGGSFNPAHYGHVYISKEAIKRVQLDQVWWLFCKKNPLKKILYESFIERKKKAEAIIKGYKKIKIVNTDDIYTYKTLKEITTRFPQYKFFWIMGMDNLLNFHKWEMYEHFHEMVKIIIIDRNKDFHKAIRSRFAIRFYQRRNWDVLLIKKKDISSTRIRNQESFTNIH